VDVTRLPTEIHLDWGGPAVVKLDVMCPRRVLSSDELHTLAEVVRSIEEMRAVIAGELPELTDRGYVP
jgi:hypothetical protein